ncbi:serine protease [Streptomyces sp. YIM 98790]|uniref:trypsin-like serine peptidase n=1 Tax=Streptomyces sp. YIM 98790 TaxID=2689077 RepID=UPI00140E20AA|nr:trypsin-like peptidase domain-containing protein [Streptomyces sp. YIM 98790]
MLSAAAVLLLVGLAAPAPAAAASPSPSPASASASASASTSATATAARPSADGRIPWPGGPLSTVGKLIWEAGEGRLGLCSGAAVEAENGSVVVTAAHCARPRGEVGAAWFVPGYDRDWSSFREDGWRVRSVHVPAGWDPYGPMTEVMAHDYAFVTVEHKDGRSLQDTHGASRLRFAPVPEQGEVTALGYPAAGPHDGEVLHYCAGPVRVLGPGETSRAYRGGLLLKGCDMNEGSSGGPWLWDFGPDSGRAGTVIGVTSAGNGTGALLGRPFPEAARSLFDTAQRQDLSAVPRDRRRE